MTDHSPTLTDVTADAWEAPIFTDLLDTAPAVAYWLYRPEMNPIVRAWFNDLCDMKRGPTVKQAAALFYRYGLMTGRAEGWTWIAKKLGSGEAAVRKLAARGLANTWIALGLRPRPLTKAQRAVINKEAREVNAWPQQKRLRFVSLDYALRHGLLNADTSEIKKEKIEKRRDFLWNREHAKHPERIEAVDPRKLMPWLN